MPTLKDLNGQRFGKLLVIGERVTINGRPRWPTRCDCGAETMKSSWGLLSGETKSCGCSIGGRPGKDMSGEKLGRLLLLERIRKPDRRNSKGVFYYKCLCDCGKTLDVNASNLVSRKLRPTRSCGCLQADSRRDPNDIELFPDHAEIIIVSETYGIKKAIVDLESLPKITPYRWSVNGEGYVGTSIKNKPKGLHHLLLSYRKGFVRDHIDRDPLNNRMSNLRYATNQQNVWNSFPDQRGYKGVYLTKDKKWRASARIRSKKVLIGDFDTQRESLMAYDFVVRKERGEFSVSNLPADKEFLIKWLGKTKRDLLRKQNELTILQKRVEDLTSTLGDFPVPTASATETP